MNVDTIDPVLTLGRVDFAYRFEKDNFRKKKDCCEFQPSLFGGDWWLNQNLVPGNYICSWSSLSRQRFRYSSLDIM